MIIKEERWEPFIIEINVNGVSVKEELKQKEGQDPTYRVVATSIDLNKACNLIIDTILSRNKDITSLYEYMHTRKQLFEVLNEALAKLTPPPAKNGGVQHEFEEVNG